MQLEVHRYRIWRTALGFYKNSIQRPTRLLYEFQVEFHEEEGIDAEALRCEFFQSILKHMDEAMFEGDEFRRVPKKDCNLERNFVCAGMMIGHSILQGGPGYACLCPAVYSFLLFGDKELALQQLPKLSDIPKNAATCGTMGSPHPGNKMHCLLIINPVLIYTSPPHPHTTTTTKSSISNQHVYFY